MLSPEEPPARRLAGSYGLLTGLIRKYDFEAEGPKTKHLHDHGPEHDDGHENEDGPMLEFDSEHPPRHLKRN